MAPEKRKSNKKAKAMAQPRQELDESSGIAESHNREGSASPPPKDEVEEKLEKLLFGDHEGFQDALRNYEGAEAMDLELGGEEDGEGDAGDNDVDKASVDMENLQDDDLYFVDTGVNGKASALESDMDTDEEEDGRPEAVPAWEDSDDERITISLQGSDRLKKLRTREADDVVNGADYVKRLRKQYERLNPRPQWAILASQASEETGVKRRKLDTDDMESESDEEDLSTQPLARLLRDAVVLTRNEGDSTTNRGKRKLRQEVLDIVRLKDVPGNQPSAIDSLCFHPRFPLLLSSGPASTLFLHHIVPEAEKPNPLVTSLHIRRTPLYTSTFSSPMGDRIFFSGRRRYFHTWNLDTGRISKVNGTGDRKYEQKTMEKFKLSPCGRFMGIVGSTRKGGGIITVLDATTLQWIAQVRIDSRHGVADFAWWRDGEGMSVVGKNGEVNEWDGRVRRIVARWTDEGAVGTTIISLGGRSGREELGGNRYVAIGSTSGIVNIYDRKPWQNAYHTSDRNTELQSGIPRNPKPIRMLDQIKTPTSHLTFSNDGQLLCMASRWKKDALRLIHLPSCTVYRNWPTSNTPLGRISAVAFSSGSDTLAVANEQGKIRLFGIQG